MQVEAESTAQGAARAVCTAGAAPSTLTQRKKAMQWPGVQEGPRSKGATRETQVRPQGYPTRSEKLSSKHKVKTREGGRDGRTPCWREGRSMA